MGSQELDTISLAWPPDVKGGCGCHTWEPPNSRPACPELLGSRKVENRLQSRRKEAEAPLLPRAGASRLAASGPPRRPGAGSNGSFWKRVGQVEKLDLGTLDVLEPGPHEAQLC